jgi:hypothetical protein
MGLLTILTLLNLPKEDFDSNEFPVLSLERFLTCLHCKKNGTFAKNVVSRQHSNRNRRKWFKISVGKPIEGARQ